MTDSRDDLEAVRRAARDLVPRLSERLQMHGLDEIEVRHGDLRVRVAGSGSPAAPSPSSGGPAATATSAPESEAAGAAMPVLPGGTEHATSRGITSPAVGFFIYADGLGPGLAVQKGDGLGWVEMLGVRHDVRAPRGGTVRNLVAESGEAVEFGQVVIELESAETSR